MRKKFAVIVAILSFFSDSALSNSMDRMLKIKDIAPYPSAEKGQVRYVIFLPVVENESNFQVELSMGKTMKVDCNSYTMGGNLESKTLQGWGYNYFVLTSVSQQVSTLMACSDNNSRETFVAIHNANRFERYNSKLPIVVYTPKDVEVRYRIWSADGTFIPVN
ncbi:serine protease inhibitor ecotin [Aeromonas jandaei]